MRTEYMAGQQIQVSQADFEGIGLDGDMYNIVDGVATRKTPEEIDAIRAAREQEVTEAEIERAAARVRDNEIESARKTEGLKDIPLDVAVDYISGQFDLSGYDAAGQAIVDFDAGAGTLKDLRALLEVLLLENRKLIVNAKKTHLREIPYLLRKRGE